MLFVPPSIPLMIPDAEAADVPDAIDDLAATVYHQRGFSSSWRSYSNVALTWTAPDDNGDSIQNYMVKIYSEQQDKFILINPASAYIPASHLYYTDAVSYTHLTLPTKRIV